MKFKGSFNLDGLESLSKNHLPALEKFGKTAAMLLSPEETCFFMDSQSSEGANISLRIRNERLWISGDHKPFTCQSKSDNHIAFTVDLQQLIKVLKTASDLMSPDMYGDAPDASVDVRLTTKPVHTPGGGGQRGAGAGGAGGDPAQAATTRAVLSFNIRGEDLAVEHDLPVSRPLISEDVQALRASVDIPVDCPFYLSLEQGQAGQVERVRMTLDKMKALQEVPVVATTRLGDLHVVSRAPGGLMLGAEIVGLSIVPEDMHAAEADLELLRTPEERLKEALRRRLAARCRVPARLLIRCLAAQQLTCAARVLIGLCVDEAAVAEQDPDGPETPCTHVSVVYAFAAPDAEGGGEGWDDAVTLSVRLPVTDDNEDM